MENFNIFNKVEEIKKEYALGDSEEICYLLNGKKYDEEYLPTLYSIDIVGGKLIVNYDDEDYSDMEINEAGRLIAKYVDKETQKIVTKDLGQVVPNFSVGNTTTGEAGTSANVSMTGTITEPVLNFTIPKGEDGEDFDGNLTNDLTITKENPKVVLVNPSGNTYSILGEENLTVESGSSSFSFLTSGNMVLDTLNINIQELFNTGKYGRYYINDSLRKTDFHDVDTTTPLETTTNCAQVISTNDASSLSNSPVTSGSFSGLWELIYLTNSMVISRIIEAYPKLGRIWCSVKTGDSWGDWVSNE